MADLRNGRQKRTTGRGRLRPRGGGSLSKVTRAVEACVNMPMARNAMQRELVIMAALHVDAHGGGVAVT
jgi:hypothetical protein